MHVLIVWVKIYAHGEIFEIYDTKDTNYIDMFPNFQIAWFF